ncbi:uncharacterized protein PHACADRAFT_263231 [Phanerochaete carnosa HHB-10118-sp]|uniref:Uncharacterized protein n=1 Tax=Phanerochaete carnosa (strain HHB-10118-sp) TaxID=650164 RepID=K5WLP2_PHACS|nr:uncharacterized protein PHACADRAFT_263231 [Phanerochaete carnosa HHB-10118-sp]EKM51212.1 hypothetical protein PHACADRAFT_263231 [Phanerochaete carnosa HHB-10118-sp]
MPEFLHLSTHAASYHEVQFLRPASLDILETDDTEQAIAHVETHEMDSDVMWPDERTSAPENKVGDVA